MSCLRWSPSLARSHQAARLAPASLCPRLPIAASFLQTTTRHQASFLSQRKIEISTKRTSQARLFSISSRSSFRHTKPPHSSSRPLSSSSSREMPESMTLSHAPRSERITDKLERPSLDNREYRVIKLPNKLEALLIHDPDTDKASAALDVNAGSFSDSNDLPGLAHAVEHALFMGTEKYPKENEYSSYLANNSGHSNAFTSSTSTNFFFEISAKSESDGDSQSPLPGALDRFAQFFIAPLFLAETLDRELRAVDSENKKNLQSDTWRLYQLQKSLSNPEHPFCHFSTGNLKTLRDEPVARGVNVRDEFMRFHKEQYSANRMKLVVLGRESLDTLQGLVETMFAEVVNKDLPQNRWDDIPVYRRADVQTQIFAKPVMDSRNLDIVFEYQDESELYETKPGMYLSHFIGHEGPGSILSYIKEKGWANSLTSGEYGLCPGSGLFSISIRLTPAGLKNYEQVVEVVFQYISILREAEPEEWRFEEVKRMAEIDFKFKQKSPASRTTSGLSSTMQEPLPREWLLSGHSLPRTFSPKAINEALQFLSPENFRLVIVTQDESVLPSNLEKEKWYGTEYSAAKIPEKFMEKIHAAYSASASTRIPELHLPRHNEFIPSASSLIVEKREVAEPAKAPKLIRNDGAVRLWHKKDDQFWVPKANFNVRLRNPICSSTTRATVLAEMIACLVRDALVEYTYDAELAGLDYSIDGGTPGLVLRVAGYNDKMHVLLKKVMSTLLDLEPRQERFDVVKERVMRGWKNAEFQSPYFQVGQYARLLSSERGLVPSMVLSELQTITIDEVRQFLPLLVRQVHIEALAHGNLHREEALRLTSLIETSLQHSRELPQIQWPIRRSILLPDGANYYYPRPLADPSNINHCIEYMLQCGTVNDRHTHAMLLLFAQMTEEPAFDTLRTKEQLGYVVFSGAAAHNSTAVYHVLVQSERTCAYLEQRIDVFLAAFGPKLRDMTPEVLEGHRRSIINKRLESLKNLSQESNRFWNHIFSEFYRFDEVDTDVEQLRTVTHKELCDFYDRYIDPSSSTRAKLAVHLVAQASAAPESSENPVDGTGEADTHAVATKIEDVHAFKASMPLSQGAKPVRDLSEYEDFDAKL